MLARFISTSAKTRSSASSNISAKTRAVSNTKVSGQAVRRYAPATAARYRGPSRNIIPIRSSLAWTVGSHLNSRPRSYGGGPVNALFAVAQALYEISNEPRSPMSSSSANSSSGQTKKQAEADRKRKEHPALANTHTDIASYPPSKVNTVLNICPQGYRCVVETFGKFSRVTEPGLFFAFPFIQQVRYVVDMRQLVIDVYRQQVYTSDNVLISVAAQLYLTVTTVEKVCYSVKQPLVAIISHTQSALRTAVGKYDLDHLLKDRNSINKDVDEALQHSTENWGIRIDRVEITELMPDEQIRAAMDLQSKAERERRQLVIAAEGKKKAAELEAEGSLNAANMLATVPTHILNYNLSLRHVDMVGRLAEHGRHTTYFVPKDISALPALADVAKSGLSTVVASSVGRPAVVQPHDPTPML